MRRKTKTHSLTAAGRAARERNKANANAPLSCLFHGVAKLADLEAREGEAPKVPSFDAYVYQGGLLPVDEYPFPVVVELLTARFERKQTQVNRNHDKERELGHTTAGRITAQGIHIEGLFSVPSNDREQIVEAARNGKEFEASIEASFPKPEFIPRGQSLRANGKTFSGPLYYARNAVITGVAILTGGADRSTQVRIAAHQKENSTMNEDLRDFIEKKGFDADLIATDATQTKFFADQLAASLKKPVKKLAKVGATDPEGDDDDTKGGGDGDDDDNALKAAQRRAAVQERCDDIERICAKHGNPQHKLEDDTECSLAAHAMRTPSMSLNEVRLQAQLWELGKKSGSASPAIHDATRFDKDAGVIECSLAMGQMGVTQADIKREGWYDEKTVNEALTARNRGMRLSRLAHMTMQQAGVYYPMGQLDDGYIQACVEAHHKLRASGFTTISLPGIMNNVASKSLMANYTRAPSFIPFWFGVTSHKDFKVTYGYQLEGSGMLEELPPDGMIKHGKLEENEFTLQLKTHAKMMALTRVDMINDDLGALSRITMILGQMAFKAREYGATQLIVNAEANGFFSTANGNLIVSNPFGITGMTASDQAFAAIVDSDGLPITVGAGNVLVPYALNQTAKQVANDTEIRDNTASAKYFVKNPHAGTFTYLSTPWLDNEVASKIGGAVNDDRATDWFRAADPSIAPAFQVAYLNGNSSPTIQSAETDFNTLGQQWRVYFDFGFGYNDPKYAQKNQAGA